jgi:ABC-2 type transport system ATP-binding protein
MPETTIAIQTKGLTKDYGPRRAVNDLNIIIEKGEIYSLLGTNGAGKTTTIKMLSCLIEPSSGTATLNGHDIKKHPMKVKEIIGVSPQETAITGHLTVKENLLLMGGVFGLPKELSRKRAQELSELMGLEDRKDQTKKLSGGLQRRLSIAMAMMSDPEILFLDEPTLGLDPAARKSVWNYIEKLKGEKTILLTTHYLEEADMLADHIAIIQKGDIIAQGTPKELKDQHSSLKKIKIYSNEVSSTCLEDLTKDGMIVKTIKNGIEIQHTDPDLYLITDILRKHKVKILGLDWEEPTLDEVFLKLTGEEVSV